MKKSLGATAAVMPCPVLIIGTYGQDGAPDAMNVAWGGQCGPKHIALNLSSHKTTENLEAKQAFTVALANRQTLVAADYVGIVSANDEPAKIEKSGLTATPGQEVDAPVFAEFPITMECKVVEMAQTSIGELRVVGEVVNTQVDEALLDEAGKIDPAKLGAAQLIAFDGMTAGYWAVSERAGQAFQDGGQLA